MIVKPATEDASQGIEQDSVVTDVDALRRQVARVHDRYGAVLVERFIAGREINVGIVDLPTPRVLPLAEIEFHLGDSFRWPVVTYGAKWEPGSADDLATVPRCPARVEPELARRIEEIALEAYRAVGCRDYGRVDVRVDPAGGVHVLEVNANPDLSRDVGLSRQLSHAGVEYATFLDHLVTRVGQRARVNGHPIGKGVAMSGELALRPATPADHPVLIDVIERCRVFRPDEIEIAREILADTTGHYQVPVVEQDGAVVGWAVWGLIPLTDAAYDLYWIAVDPNGQGRGVGQFLLEKVEEAIRQRAGRWVIAETSATEAYAAAQRFYQRAGYDQASRLDDFYRPGDGKLTFAKRLDR